MARNTAIIRQIEMNEMWKWMREKEKERERKEIERRIANAVGWTKKDKADCWAKLRELEMASLPP